MQSVLLIGILVAVCFLVVISTTVITLVVEGKRAKNKMTEKIFLGQLVNLDCSMSSALEYLKLTNSINSANSSILK